MQELPTKGLEGPLRGGIPSKLKEKRGTTLFRQSPVLVPGPYEEELRRRQLCAALWASMACKASIIFCADSSMSITRLSIRDTK